MQYCDIVCYRYDVTAGFPIGVCPVNASGRFYECGQCGRVGGGGELSRSIITDKRPVSCVNGVIGFLSVMDESGAAADLGG